MKTTAKQINASVESLPRPAPPAGAILNSPPQSNGSFVIGWNKPITGQDWPVLSKHMWKYSADDLEEFDMFDSEPGWRISEPGLIEASKLGYEIILDGLKIDFTSGKTIAEQVQSFRKAEQEKQQAAAKQAREAAAAIKAKEESWLAGKVVLCIPERDIHFEKIDEICHWRHISGSSFVQLIKFTAPPEIAGLEGVWRADHDYDTHYDSYYAPADVANKLNAPIIERRNAENHAMILATPEFHEVEHAANAARQAGITFSYCNCKPEEIAFIEANAGAIITAWIDIKRGAAATGQEKMRYGSSIRSFSGTFWHPSEERLADVLGIKAELDATWEATKVTGLAKIKVEAERKEAEQKAAREKYQAEIAARAAERQAKITSISASIKGTKQELMDKYPGAGLKKSWTRDQMVSTIARAMADGRPVEKKAPAKASEDDFEEGPDIY
nr:hypothetical protein [Candidatus Sigynarchaeum springense]